MFPFKSRAELQALPPPARLRYLARSHLVIIALSILFGLQIAFVEGVRLPGLALVGLGVVSLASPLLLTLRARRLTPDRDEEAS